MIQLEPGEPTNYFALATIYEEAGVYDEAENMLQAARKAKPSDPAVYLTLASYYNRQGQFDKTIEALEERAAERAEQPRGLLHDLGLLLGKGVPRLQADAKKRRKRSSTRAKPPSTRRSS